MAGSSSDLPEDVNDRPPPEPAPSDWAPPTPVDARTAAAAAVAQTEAADLAKLAHSKKRRFWVTTVVFVALWLGSLGLIHVEGVTVFTPLILLLPLYLLTLPFVLRTPKRLRQAKAKLVDRISWQAKLMVAVAVFLAVYIPFTFVSGAIIPFASLVEYVLFAVLLFVLIRLGGRSIGVAPSVDALPPPTHRLHQQVITPLDDAHYQKTLWLNFSFVEKGRGGRNLAKRLDELLTSLGVEDARRRDVLSELEAYRDEGGLTFTRRGRERRAAGQERRTQVLERVFGRVRQELEHAA